MKKFLCLFSALSIVLMSSCSSDDTSNEGGSDALLPKKIVETSVENGISGTLDYTFTYDGNKLKQVSLSDASKYVYTYTGDLITKVEKFYSSELQSTDVYAYEGGKLISKITTQAFGSAPQEKLTLVYNANGTVNANQSQIINKQEIKYDSTTLITFANGNVISSEYIDGVKEKTTSTFDDKKSPFTNITGAKLLLDLDHDFDYSSVNNPLTSTTVETDGSGKVVQTATVKYTNKYNASNFLSEVSAGDAKNSFKLEFTYN